MNVSVNDGTAEVKFPIALNDPAGMWTLTARDAATGCRSEDVFYVE
jgi:hypothetical protein